MSQALLISDNDQLNNMHALNFKMYVGTDVIVKKRYDDAIDLLAVHPGIDVIICMANIGDDRTAFKIHKYLDGKDRDIPMIILGEEPGVPNENAVELETNVELKILIRTVAGILGVSAKDMINQIVSDYVPIPISNFIHIESSICDAYIRVKKGQGEYQYIKRVNAQETLEEGAIEKYRKEGIENFYIPSEFRLKFVNSFSEQINAKLNDTDLSAEERTKVTNVAYQSVAEQMQTLGITENVITFSKSTMASIVKQVDDSPKLARLLKLVMSDQGSYHYRHTQIVTFVCTHIVNNIDWGTREQSEKLAFVAFFHDITLVDERLAKVRTNKELKEGGFSFEEQECVRNHAKQAVLLLETYPHMPIGADVIIKQHHGHKMGNGFPERFSNDLSPLSVIFIVAQDLTDYILEYHGTTSFKLKAFIEKLYEKYKLPKFVKAIDALKTLKL